MTPSQAVKRTPSEMAADVLYAIATGGPGVMADIARRCDVDPDAQVVDKYVHALHNRGFVFRHRWATPRSPVWAFSPIPFACADAPRPGDTP